MVGQLHHSKLQPQPGHTLDGDSTSEGFGWSHRSCGQASSGTLSTNQSASSQEQRRGSQPPAAAAAATTRSSSSKMQPHQTCTDCYLSMISHPLNLNVSRSRSEYHSFFLALITTLNLSPSTVSSLIRPVTDPLEAAISEAVTVQLKNHVKVNVLAQV